MRNPHVGVDLIEVFAPDDAALWAEVAHTPTEHRLARRGPVLIGLLVISLLGAGTVALSDDGQSEVATSTTILTTATTVRSQLEPTLDATSSPHYLIADAALTAYSADIVTPPSTGQQIQVWSNGTDSGPVVIIELHPHPYQSYGIVAASRELVDDVELVNALTQPAILVSEVAIDESWSATVRATQLDGAEVARIVHSVTVVDSRLAQDASVMADLGLGLTFEDESLENLIFGRVESTVRYLTATGTIVTLHSAMGSSEHRLTIFSLPTTDAQPISFGSSYRRLPNGDSVVMWEDDGTLLSLVAPGDPADLIAIRQRVRMATQSEWVAMVYGLRPDYTLGSFATLDSGQGSNGEHWRAGPQIAQRRGRTEFLWWWTVPGSTGEISDVTASTAASLDVGSQARFDSVVVPGAMFVFVSQPHAGGNVIVRAADGTEYVAELVQPFTQSSVFMAVVRVEAPGAVTVSINGEPVPA